MAYAPAVARGYYSGDWSWTIKLVCASAAACGVYLVIEWWNSPKQVERRFMRAWKR